MSDLAPVVPFLSLMLITVAATRAGIEHALGRGIEAVLALLAWLAVSVFLAWTWGDPLAGWLTACASPVIVLLPSDCGPPD